MNTHLESKTATVRRAPYELFMSFTDMRNFREFLPEDKKQDVEADFDSLRARVQGYEIGIRVEERSPYSKIVVVDDGAPFPFRLTLHFDASAQGASCTDFHISVEAELNLMMKMMLKGKLQDMLDKVVDGLAAASEGRMPEGYAG